MKIYPIGRLFTLKIGEIVFKFKQLTYLQKDIIGGESNELKNGVPRNNLVKEAYYTIKYSLKEVHGLTDENGEPYCLAFENGDDCLTDECVEELLAAEFHNELLYSGMNIIDQNVPTKILHPITKEEIEGVEIVAGESLKKK